MIIVFMFESIKTQNFNVVSPFKHSFNSLSKQ